MKNLILCIAILTVASCNPRVSINSGKNDSSGTPSVDFFSQDAFQVTYEESSEDRRLRKELLDNIRDFTPSMPELDQSIVYRVQYKAPKNISYFLGELECAYRYDREIIEERISEVNAAEQTYKITKRSTPIMESLVFLGDNEDDRNRCNLDIDQLNTENILPIDLEDHFLKMKAIATERLNNFADMCRYGGFLSTGEDCFGHRIEVSKEELSYTIDSDIRAATVLTSYSWELSLEAPQFTLGFERGLTGDAPEFESLNPHFYQTLEIL